MDAVRGDDIIQNPQACSHCEQNEYEKPDLLCWMEKPCCKNVDLHIKLFIARMDNTATAKIMLQQEYNWILNQTFVLLW